MLIVLEGIDGSGKTSVATALKKRFDDDAIILSMPTKKVRANLTKDTSTVSSILMHLEDFAEVIHNTIAPALLEGRTVIMDRFWPSTIIYQGEMLRKALPDAGLDIPLHDLQQTLSWGITYAFAEACSGKNFADAEDKFKTYFVIIDVPAEVAYQRATARKGEVDMYEEAPVELWEERRQRYLELDAQDDLFGATKIVIPYEGENPETIAAKLYEVLHAQS